MPKQTMMLTSSRILLEYFDTRDDFGEVLRKPNLIREMKQTPFSFNLKDDAEVFTHHPSIWSALYKKDFLDFNEIRFVEPRGAGWQIILSLLKH